LQSNHHSTNELNGISPSGSRITFPEDSRGREEKGEGRKKAKTTEEVKGREREGRRRRQQRKLRGGRGKEEGEDNRGS
jgi:hypothetical protein